MLISGFSGDSENVYVNLLTYNDLQLLKARKLGVSTSFSSQSSSQTFPSSTSQSKRYIILTYASEFDRVNFPLPLSFEENPNVQSLQRTIKRLRMKLKDAQSIHHTSKER
jgi:coiled-coil domain-containing protein 61